MERNSIEREEQSQDDDEQQLSTKPNNDNISENNGHNINELFKIQAENVLLKEQQGAESKISKLISMSVLKLKQRTNNIRDKLSKKRTRLQQQKVKALKGEVSIKKNQNKVSMALRSMATKTKSRNHEEKSECLNSTVPIEANKPIEIIPNEVAENPLHKQTKEELITLVEGLQELFCRLTTHDRKLRKKVKRLANNISCLQDFPILNNTLHKEVSTASGKQHLNSNDSKVDKKRSSRHNSETVKEKKIAELPKLTPAEKFAKYTNAILEESLGNDEKKNLEKYKCLPSLDNDYLEKYAFSLAEAGFGCIAEGEIRINRKNNRQAFMVIASDRDRDAIITSYGARQYAFNGDIVRAFVFNTKNSITNEKHNTLSLTDDDELLEDIDNEMLPESEYEDAIENVDNTVSVVSEYCRKAFVINIIKQIKSKEIVGCISFENTTELSSKAYYKFKTHDMRLPIMYIPQELCKDKVESTSKDDICGMLYVAKILETDKDGHCIGELVQPVGKAGNLEAEIKAILLHNGLKDIKPYEQKFIEMYEGPTLPLTNEDFKNREDLRKKCIFTIDPLTARDLDDAVSIEKLNEQEYEIGVHISDVSYYLTENSELDNLVKHRATSIYLVNEVIHMLPPSLCFKCSLLPGKDKLTFSVFWRWHTEKEEISSPRFTRSVINSCSQLAYEHAQKFIDNPKENFDHNDIPDIYNDWKPDDLKWRILLLHDIAQKLKAQRYENGALSINNPKLRLNLHSLTGEPISYELEERQEANFLIEELMLLANQSVAKFIHDRFPDISVLRNHGPPLQRQMLALKERLNTLGLEFNITSSKAIFESMQRLCKQASDPKAFEACLNTLLTKPMARAKYFCSEGKTSEADFRHYALSIPIYTHFTSPIRRYPDILVHRLLAAALNYCPPPQRTTDELHDLVKICNDQKLNAKNAGDESIELFFKRYVKAKKAVHLKAAVIDIYKHMLNVVSIETGHVIPITYKMQNVLLDTSNIPSFLLVIDKNSKIPTLKLELFSTVNIKLVIKDGKLCGFIVPPDSKQRRRQRRGPKELCEESLKEDTNGSGNPHQNNSICEEEFDYYQEASPNSINRRKLLRLKKTETARVSK